MNHVRHSGIFDVSDLSVTLVGAGGIGAMTALILAKMGVRNLVVYDDDTVSEVNMPTQLHRLADLDRPKVFGLEEVIRMFSDDTSVYPEVRRIDQEDVLFGQIVISAVDSIQARKAIWAAVERGQVGWYLDARMSAEEFQLFTVDMSSPKRAQYARMLLEEDDSKVLELPCTSKATIFCSSISAGQVGSAVRKIATGLRPAYCLVHNILNDRLFHLGDA